MTPERFDEIVSQIRKNGLEFTVAQKRILIAAHRLQQAVPKVYDGLTGLYVGHDQAYDVPYIGHVVAEGMTVRLPHRNFVFDGLDAESFIEQEETAKPIGPEEC